MELEPHPIENEELWAEGSPQYLERYEYIEERANRYLNQYRESEEYDFTKFGNGAHEKAIIRGYDDFAKGTLKLLGMEVICRSYRDAMKRKVATPLTEEEKAAAAEAKKPVPKWRKDWEAKRDAAKKKAKEDLLRSQPSPDRDKRICERGYVGRTETSPMPGLNCYSVNEDQGWLEDGTEVDRPLAYCHVHWDRYEYENPGKFRPDSLRPRPPEEVKVQKTLEDLERERLAIIEKDRQDRLAKTLSRGKRPY